MITTEPTFNEKPEFLRQTNKYIKRLDTELLPDGKKSREYLTTSDPESNVPHFTKFVEDGAYAEALSGKVIQCVDIMVFDPNTHRVLIGTRDQEPQAGDWVIGGGMRAGETVAQAAERNMRRELKIDIDKTQLREVGNYKFIWDSRANPSTINEAGQEVVSCHTSSTLESYPVDESSIDLSKFNEEYAEVKWVDLSNIVDAPEGIYHPCLVDMATDLMDQITTPEVPKTKAEAIQRQMGAIGYIKAHGPITGK